MQVRRGTTRWEGLRVVNIIPASHPLLSLRHLMDELRNNSNRLRAQEFGPWIRRALFGSNCRSSLLEVPKCPRRYPLGCGQGLRCLLMSDKWTGADLCCSGYHPREGIGVSWRDDLHSGEVEYRHLREWHLAWEAYRAAAVRVLVDLNWRVLWLRRVCGKFEWLRLHDFST